MSTTPNAPPAIDNCLILSSSIFVSYKFAINLFPPSTNSTLTALKNDAVTLIFSANMFAT